MIGVVILLNVRCYDGWAAVVRVLRWLGCGAQSTAMLGLRW